MGKKSVKENKNIYQLCREELGLTRDAASNLMEYISADRIEKIESEKSLPHPDEVLAMAKCYGHHELCNHFCSHECPIGQEFVPEVSIKDFSQIVLEMLATLNSLNKDKDRLIEISADGEVSQDEYEDFFAIQDKLNQISMTADSMQIWVKNTLNTLKEEKKG